MTGNLEAIRKTLDEIALCVVTMEPDDIQALGTILNNIEQVQNLAMEAEPPPWRLLAGTLWSIAEKMALFEAPSPEQALTDLGAGVSLLQETCGGQSGNDNEKSRIEHFVSHCCVGAGSQAGSDGDPEADQIQDEAAPEQDLGQDRELVESFIQEAGEHLSTIEFHILELEKDPDNIKLVDAIFRPFHTIKGVSGFLNLKDINHLAHNIETVLDDARNRKIPVSPTLVDMVLDGVDLVSRLIGDVHDRMETGRTQPGEFEIEPFIQRLHELGNDATLTAPDEDSAIVMPSDDGNDMGQILLRQGVVSPQDLESALAKQQEKGGKRIGEILMEEKKATARDVAQALRVQKSARQPGAGEGAAGGGFIKVDTVKLDNMVDMVGELVINEAMIKGKLAAVSGKDRELAGNLAQLGRITSEIQRIAMSMRMIPIKSTFQKMTRLVRDLSAKAGKKVTLAMQGEDTEIDRNMVDMIYDPLVHMVRNSADHGLETPQERIAAGKPETGTILLNAYHKGGAIIIEVTDDGRGLDREAIIAKALERKLIQPGQNLTDQDVFGLIFHPGFSTAKKVTDVSGRGVGMDVVKGALDKMRGKIEVNSQAGKGTTILLKLPLTLAVIDGIITRAGEQSYVVPTVSVLESIRPTREDCHTVVNQGEMIRIRGNLYPLIRLHELFGFQPGQTAPWEAIVVIAESEGKRKCILVDEIIGKQEVVIKSLTGMLKNVAGLAGGAILANGRVGMILDVAGLFALGEDRKGPGGPPAGTDGAPPP